MCTTRGDVHAWACLHVGTCTCKHKRAYTPHAQVHMQTDAKHLCISTHIQKGNTPRQMHTHENSHAYALKHPKPILGLTPRPKDKVMCIHPCIHTQAHTCLPVLRIEVCSHLIAEPTSCPFGVENWRKDDSAS